MTTEQMQNMDFALLCQRRSDAEAHKRMCEAEFEVAKSVCSDIDAVLIERFDESGARGYDTSDFHISTKVSLYASAPFPVTVASEFAANGYPDMAKLTINGNTLAAAIREIGEDTWKMGQPDSFPGWIQSLVNTNCLKISIKPSISMRKK